MNATAKRISVLFALLAAVATVAILASPVYKKFKEVPAEVILPSTNTAQVEANLRKIDELKGAISREEDEATHTDWKKNLLN